MFGWRLCDESVLMRCKIQIRLSSWKCVLAVASAVVLFVSNPVLAKADSNCVETNDVWLVSTRCRCVPTPAEVCQANAAEQIVDSLSISQIKPDGKMKASSYDKFVRTLTPDTIVCVWVDGNRVDGDYSIRRSWLIQKALKVHSSQKLRIVIWSWPSQTVAGPVKDIQAKICRTEAEAVWLASFLAGLPSSQPVTILGYSLGARIAYGSLSLLASQSFAKYQLPLPTETCQVRLVFIAPAVPNSWLCHDHACSLALTKVQRMLILGNRRDKVLKYFPYSPGANGNLALAVSAVRPDCLGEHATRVQQYDFSQQIGRSHKVQDYLQVPAAVRLIRHYSLWNAVD